MNKTPKNNVKTYLRCGSSYHWARTCHTPQHLAELYKGSLKEKKNVETNYIDHSDPWEFSDLMDITPLDVSNFFVDNGNHVDDMISSGVLDNN